MAPAAIDRYLLQTPPLLLSIDGTDRLTDARPLKILCSVYYAGRVNNEPVFHVERLIIPVKVITGVRLSVCLSVCYHDN